MALKSHRAGEINEGQFVLDSTLVLKECCDLGTPCRFQLIHSQKSFRAAFLALKSNGIELGLLSADTEEQLRPGALCCVSFPFQTLLCAFLGRLVEASTQPSGERRMIATIPKQLTVTNLRQAFRVPVVPLAGLETTIRFADQQFFSAKACDVTAAAIKVEFFTDDHPSLSLGTTVSIEIRFRGELIEKTCTVHRLAGPHCVLLFAGPTSDEERRKAGQWHGIVLALQQLWLKSRLK